MGRFGVQLLGLVMILLPLCLLVAGPIIVFGLSGKRRWWQMMLAVFGGYLLLAAIIGAYTYTVVPGDYTRPHSWTRQPTSSSLGDQHGHALVVARAREATFPEESEGVRARVRQERREYLDDWSRLTLYGLIAPVLTLVWWHFRRPHTGNPSPRSSLANAEK